MKRSEYHMILALLWTNLLPHISHPVLITLVCIPIGVSFYRAARR